MWLNLSNALDKDHISEKTANAQNKDQATTIVKMVIKTGSD